MSIPFRERNPVPIGAIGLLCIGLVLFLAFNVQSIPFIGGGDHYRAAFSEAGGLIKGDDVRIAGVKVGKVRKVDLAGNRVIVDFVVTEPAAFGTQTGASVRMKTLLGSKYLALEPAGGGQLTKDSEIPLERTVSSYDIVNAFTDLATTSEQIDTDALAKSLTTLATEFTNTSAMAQQLTGLVRDNRAELKPALDQLTKVLAVLQKHEKDLGDTIAAMGPFTRLFANVLGNGRWFDTYIANLTSPVATGGN